MKLDSELFLSLGTDGVSGREVVELLDLRVAEVLDFVFELESPGVAHLESEHELFVTLLKAAIERESRADHKNHRSSRAFITTSTGLFGVLRDVFIDPLTRWYRRHEVIAQLERLATLGKGVSICGPISIGNPQNTYFGEAVSIQQGFSSRGLGKLIVGSHVHIGENVTIGTSDFHFDRSDVLPGSPQMFSGDITIGDCTWIGDHVLVMPCVSIGEGAILAAGAVITEDIPPLSIVSGSPAKVVRKRESAYYEFLRKQSRYLDSPRDYDTIDSTRVKIRRMVAA